MGENDDKLNIVKKLQKIVKQRNTKMIVNKREIGYRPSRSNFSSYSGESYLNNNDE